MFYYTMTATSPDQNPRFCAMFEAASPTQAVQKAKAYHSENMLLHVDPKSTFAIRRSSRKEISLFETYMNSCQIPDLNQCLQSDIDTIIARRNTLLLGFFVALYINPDYVINNTDLTQSLNKPLLNQPNIPLEPHQLSENINPTSSIDYHQTKNSKVDEVPNAQTEHKEQNADTQVNDFLTKITMSDEKQPTQDHTIDLEADPFT